ncbi:MAG: protein phosphatase 2C domain-containing protein [Chloroflexales bacterium]
MVPLLQWFHASDRGRVREANEDSVMSYPIAEELARRPSLVPPGGRLCVVADGMGGHRGGREASSMAVRRIAMLYYGQQSQRPGEALAAAIQQASHEILLLGQSDPALDRMGTTVVLATMEAGTTYVANVGDSRAYHWRGGRLQMISVDDRWVATQVREQALTEEQARNHMYRSVLMQNLGSAEPVEPHLADVLLLPGDLLLLCTDGLFDLVSDEEIRRALGTLPPERVPQRLVDLALRRGAPDNVTVAVGYYGPPRPRRSPGWLIFSAALTILLTLVALAALGVSMWRQTSSAIGEISSAVAAPQPRETSRPTAAPTSTTMPPTAEPTAALPVIASEPTATAAVTATQASPVAGGEPRIDVSGPLTSPDALTAEEQVVYQDCVRRRDHYLNRAGVIIARAEQFSTLGIIRFLFSTTLQEPQEIVPGNKTRNDEFKCSFISEGVGTVFVSGDGIPKEIPEPYSFMAEHIYLVKYDASGGQ